jgi:antitoxin component YwqK of YwqJK toxin-antitoxin module
MSEQKNGIVHKYHYNKYHYNKYHYNEYYNIDKTKLRSKYFIFNGKIEGKYVQYHKNGQLEKICNYRNGKKEGEYKEYHENGKIWIICNFKNGLKEGKYKIYDVWGYYLAYECNYKDDKMDGELYRIL